MGMVNQRKRIMEYMSAGHSLTSDEAREKFGIARLASRVSELREAGIPIGDKWEVGQNRYGEDVRWKRYFLLQIGDGNDLQI